MMNPPIEDLLDRVDSKFTLVTLAAMRARADQRLLQPARRGPRHDRAAAGHLGVPQAAVDRASRRSRPTRSSTSSPIPRSRDRRGRGRAAAAEQRARRRLSRVLAGRARRPRCLRRHRRLQGGRGLPPPRRRRRPRDARSSPRARSASSGATTFSALASEPAQHVAVRRRRPDPAHPPRPDRRPRRGRARPPPGCSASTPPASPTTCSPPRCSPPGPRCSSCPAMHTEMWEHPAVQDNLATLRRRGVHVVEPEVGPPRRRRRRRRPPGRPGRASSPRSRRVLAPPRPRRACGSSSPPAAPASRSTRCGSSATARRASRATPSPRRPPRRGAEVTLVTTVDRPRAGRRRGRARSRPRPRCSDAVLGRADARRRGRDGRRGRRLPARRRRPTGKLKKDDGVARDRPRADPRHPRRARARASAPGQVLVGFAAETDDLRRQRRGQAARASASTSSSPTTSARPDVGLRARHQRA